MQVKLQSRFGNGNFTFSVEELFQMFNFLQVMFVACVEQGRQVMIMSVRPVKKPEASLDFTHLRAVIVTRYPGHLEFLQNAVKEFNPQKASAEYKMSFAKKFLECKPDTLEVWTVEDQIKAAAATK